MPSLVHLSAAAVGACGGELALCVFGAKLCTCVYFSLEEMNYLLLAFILPVSLCRPSPTHIGKAFFVHPHLCFGLYKLTFTRTLDGIK